MGILSKIKDFFRGIFFELKKVNWPTRKELLYLTFIVIISMLIAMLFIAGVDYVLSKILEFIVAKK
jgi:preprotein translocase subunit SecE